MENLPALNLKNLDNSQWKTYRFDEIAKNISERVDPNNTDLEVYVGLEHIDSESIHLKRSGTPDDVDGQKLRFYKGDLIFGRRRAYQRKAAIATSDGFCSAHALVLRANPEVIHPQLFPFFMHSDAFMHRAVDISVGSLSPTINWGDLKHQKFYIPAGDQQSNIAELLWSLDCFIQKQESLLNSIKSLILTKRSEHFRSNLGKTKSLGEVATVRAGIGFPMKFQGHSDKEVMFFKVGDMNSELNQRELTSSDHTVSYADLKELKGKLHEKGTVVFPKVGAAIATEKKRILVKDSLIDNNVMGVSSKDKRVLPPEYLLEFFNTVSLEKISNTGAVPSINADIIKSIKLNLPNPEVIDLYLYQVNSLLKLDSGIFNALKKTIELKNSLVNKIF